MQEDPQQPQNHQHDSVSNWMIMLLLVFIAALFAMFVLVEMQVLRLQRTVDKAIEQYTQSERPTKGKNTAQSQTQTKPQNETDDTNTSEGTEPETTNEQNQGPELEVYTNTDLGYRISLYPGTTTQQHQDDVTFSGDIAFEIRRSGSGSDTEIELFFDGAVSDTTIVDGHTANVTVNDTGNCDGPACGNPYIAYSMLEDGYNYTIVFYGDAALSATESRVLSSFEFLN